MNFMHTCVSCEGNFIYGIHSPAFRVKNLRANDRIYNLGEFEDGSACGNRINFPAGDIDVPTAGPVFEVPNAFAFRGVTYINKKWADENAQDPVGLIRLPGSPDVSFSSVLSAWKDGKSASNEEKMNMLLALPGPLRLALAETGTDPDDLVCLAQMACDFVYDRGSGRPAGLVYAKEKDGQSRAKIHDHTLFEVLANNPYLPEVYREVMVLRPGVQGANEIVGEYVSQDGSSHVYEYLRSNSYIPWGHYAANMAEDSI
ncbi:MAG: hypothetical protein KGY38_04255, partial [Desulfobacterales bacterium]|nr:hypothetical protein [Desulfobacterales bacterium]